MREGSHNSAPDEGSSATSPETINPAPAPRPTLECPLKTARSSPRGRDPGATAIGGRNESTRSWPSVRLFRARDSTEVDPAKRGVVKALISRPRQERLKQNAVLPRSCPSQVNGCSGDCVSAGRSGGPPGTRTPNLRIKSPFRRVLNRSASSRHVLSAQVSGHLRS